MKRLIATVTCLVALMVAAIPVSAQTRTRHNNRTAQERRLTHRYNETYRQRQNQVRVYNDTYRTETYDDGYYGYDDRSRWEKSRDKITTAGGAIGGAVLGGLMGGKKGAIIGAITGGGAAAIYTYKIRDKNDRY